jgi:hypothetical protein
MVWGGLTGPASMGHFHTGLLRQAGPVVFDLMPFFNNASNGMAAEGFWKPTNAAPNAARPFTLRRSVQFRRDSMYVNIHTAQFPGGEIRGQVFRGARNLSRVLSAQPAAVVAETFGIYPNPTQNQLQINFEGRVTDSGTISISDVLGREVLSQGVNVQPGRHQVALVVNSLKAGIYFVTLNVSGTKIVTKFVKE